MAVFSAISAAIGAIGSSITGAVGAAGTAASAASGGISAAGLTAATGLIGTGVSAIGQFQAMRSAKKAEALREQQMNIEAMRARRQTVRQAIVARAQSLNTSEAQGAGGSSGQLGGVYGVQSQAASNIQGINQSQQISQGIFQANRGIAAGQSLSGFGQSLQGFSSWFANNRETLSRAW